MPDDEQTTMTEEPEPFSGSKEKDCFEKIEELRFIFPWVQKEQVNDLFKELYVNWKFSPKAILGVGAYKENENNLAQYKRALGCLIHFLKDSKYSLKCSFKSDEVEFTCNTNRRRENLELVELELLCAESSKDADRIFKIQNSVPGIDVLWALAFNVDVCAQFGNSYPILLIPGIEVDNKFVAVYCVNRSICLTTISKNNIATKVCYPKY